MAEHRSVLSRGPSLALAGVFVLALAGCGGGQTRPNTMGDYWDPRQTMPKGSISGNDGPLVSIGRGRSSGEDGGGALGVNAFLWRGSLDTLSFMPLASADPFGGVIITDWYEPPTGTNERFKATAYILGRQLRADGVRVSLFRQVYQGGRWVDAGVAPTAVTEIENKILARARDLRAQSSGAS